MLDYLRKSRLNRKESGLTLLELTVAIVLMSLLAGILLQVTDVSYKLISEGRSKSRLQGELHSAGQQLTNELRSLTNRFEMSGNRFRFIGVDGDGNKYEHINTDDNRPDSPEDVDHLHLRAIYADTDSESGNHGKLQVCFFLNDGDHPFLTSTSGDESQWALLRRDRRTDNPQTDITDLDGTDPIGYNIDYLSFRYYDSDTNKWYHEWDSLDTDLTQVSYRGEFPDAIEFALRVYDPASNIEPRWFITTVSLSEK